MVLLKCISFKVIIHGDLIFCYYSVIFFESEHVVFEPTRPYGCYNLVCHGVFCSNIIFLTFKAKCQYDMGLYDKRY